MAAPARCLPTSREGSDSGRDGYPSAPSYWGEGLFDAFAPAEDPLSASDLQSPREGVLPLEDTDRWPTAALLRDKTH